MANCHLFYLLAYFPGMSQKFLSYWLAVVVAAASFAIAYVLLPCFFVGEFVQTSLLQACMQFNHSLIYLFIHLFIQPGLHWTHSLSAKLYWGRNSPWVGCQLVTRRHAHTFTPRCNLESPIHPLTSLGRWEETREICMNIRWMCKASRIQQLRIRIKLGTDIIQKLFRIQNR